MCPRFFSDESGGGNIPWAQGKFPEVRKVHGVCGGAGFQADGLGGVRGFVDVWELERLTLEGVVALLVAVGCREVCGVVGALSEVCCDFGDA